MRTFSLGICTHHKYYINQIVITLINNIFQNTVSTIDKITKSVTSKWTICKIKMNKKCEQNIITTTCSITMNRSKTSSQLYCLTQIKQTSLTTLFLTLNILN